MDKSNIFLDMGEVFTRGGHICQSLAGFEVRPQQVEMACAVHQALLGGRRLVVEAGTGVGKSFAYLAPVIDSVSRCGCRVLISTFTITLQEQLINKDIPFLADCMRFPQRGKPYKFTSFLAKGRGNYLCKRRLEFVLQRQMELLAPHNAGALDGFGSELSMIRKWARETQDGSLSDIGFVPSHLVWDAVRSEHGNCRGRKCPYFQDCFYWRARRRLESADIIVANHALLFSDLVLKEEGAAVLPDYRYVVVDEAHNIEHVAEEHFGIDISNRKIKFMLNGLYNPRTRKGLLAYINADKAIEIVGRIDAEAKILFKHIRRWYEQTKNETNGRCYQNFVDDRIGGHLKELRLELAKLAKKTESIDEKFEIMHFVDRFTVLARDLNCFLMQERKDCVYWVELGEGREASVHLKSAAVDVGPDVKRCLFDKYESVILTSATLSSGNIREDGGFDFFAGRIGLEDFIGLKLGSPFEYQKQVTIYIEKDLPNPNESAFNGVAAEAVKKYILKTGGRAFVLFTSYEMLDDVAEKVTGLLTENDIELLLQGAGLDRSTLLKLFKKRKRVALFGTDSFWQGVDMPGDALGNVIIVRLPFAVPDKPLLAGRLEQIREQGGNPFYDYQLPLAIIKFKQGFGRLIRNKTDTGIVVILDSRVVNKRYGKRFLASIPKCRVEIVAAEK